MAFTSADLSSIDSAIVDLATGSTAIELTLSSGKRIRYAEKDIDKLIKLRSIISASISTGGFFNKVKFNDPV